MGVTVFSRWHWFGLAALVVVADQLTKLWALTVLEFRQPLEVTPFFNLLLVFNPGGAFSFLADAGDWQRHFFIIVTVGISLVVTVWLIRSTERGKTLLPAALALILGGAIGNLVDRVRLGHVVDFLDFHVAGWHWPAFNIADAAIVCGAGLLIFATMTGRD